MHLALANIFRLKGEFDKEAFHLTKFLEFRGRILFNGIGRTTDTLVRLGDAYRAQGKRNLALNSYQEAASLTGIEYTADDASQQLRLVASRFKLMGDTDTAQKLLSRVK